MCDRQLTKEAGNNGDNRNEIGLIVRAHSLSVMLKVKDSYRSNISASIRMFEWLTNLDIFPSIIRIGKRFH